MEKRSFLNPFRTRIINFCFIAVGAIFIASISIYYVARVVGVPSPILNLNGAWEVCVDGECEESVVPATVEHPKPAAKDYRHITYRKSFSTPAECITSRCGILFSEIGDSAEVYLNGQRIAVHGGIGKEFVFSKHYPVFESVDSKTFKKHNVLEVQVETAKIYQSGIRGEINAFVPYKEGQSYVLGRYIYDIYTPLAGALLLLALCLYTVRKLFRAQRTKPDLQALTWALASMALVMISSSNVPREFLPTWVCAYGHFLLKHGVDWSLFYLAYEFYRERFTKLGWMNWWVYFSVAVFMTSVFIGQLFLPVYARENTGVLIPFVAMQVLFPLRILPYILMFVGSLNDKREQPWGRYVSSILVIGFLSLQIADLLLSWGLRSGSYYVRFFPVLIGIFYASKIFEIYDEEMSDRVLDGENAKGYRRMGMQAAHDLKSPLMSIRHQLRKLESIPSKERETITSSIDTISRISGSLEREFQSQEEVFMSCRLANLCEKVVLEKKAEFRDKSSLQINYICEADMEEVTAFIDAVELKRVISNLINNSMQAITLDMQGLITVSLSLKRKYAYISIKDNGRGIPEDKIPSLFGRGATTRRDGKGLGLAHAKETLKVLGGKLELESKAGHGTEVTLLVPIESQDEKVEVEKQNIFTLPTSKSKTCVLIDDDQMVTDIWKEEAGKAKVNLVVFSSPREASTALVKFDKNFTEFFVDVSFGGEVLGTVFAKKLLELGFRKVTLSTAYPLTAFTDLKGSGIKVAGKEPPWTSIG